MYPGRDVWSKYPLLNITKLAIVIHYGHTILRYNHNSYNDRFCGYFTCLYANDINSNGNLTSAVITLYMTCLKCVKLTTARFSKHVATCDGVEVQITHSVLVYDTWLYQHMIWARSLCKCYIMHIMYNTNFWQKKTGEFLIRNVWWVKLWQTPACLLSL